MVKVELGFRERWKDKIDGDDVLRPEYNSTKYQE
jgi:hypothetical protein